MTERQARAVIEAQLCWCGRAKQSGPPFCYHCLRHLGVAQLFSVGLGVGKGFEAGYESALAYLKQVIRIHNQPRVPKRGHLRRTA